MSAAARSPAIHPILEHFPNFIKLLGRSFGESEFADGGQRRVVVL